MNIEDLKLIRELRDGCNALLINSNLPTMMQTKYLAAVAKADEVLKQPVCLQCKHEVATHADTWCTDCLNS